MLRVSFSEAIRASRMGTKFSFEPTLACTSRLMACRCKRGGQIKGTGKVSTCTTSTRPKAVRTCFMEPWTYLVPVADFRRRDPSSSVANLWRQIAPLREAWCRPALPIVPTSLRIRNLVVSSSAQPRRTAQLQIQRTHFRITRPWSARSVTSSDVVDAVRRPFARNVSITSGSNSAVMPACTSGMRGHSTGFMLWLPWSSLSCCWPPFASSLSIIARAAADFCLLKVRTKRGRLLPRNFYQRKSDSFRV
mmetsp:Transcript_59672/g.131023  ORF Transcript_59672/g.131023 Transcript_59672/m.131023 type:complete len:249 (-) Transcript_59672:532-1278(-)